MFITSSLTTLEMPTETLIFAKVIYPTAAARTKTVNNVDISIYEGTIDITAQSNSRSRVVNNASVDIYSTITIDSQSEGRTRTVNNVIVDISGIVDIVSQVDSRTRTVNNPVVTGAPYIGLANTYATNPGVAVTQMNLSYPAYSDGDMILCFVGIDRSDRTQSWSATGPNGETIVELQTNISSDDGNRASCFYWIGVGSEPSGTFAITNSSSEECKGTVAHIAAGQFNSTAPIDAHAYDGYIATAGNSYCSSPELHGVNPYGTVVTWVVSDNVHITANPAGWTELTNEYDTFIGSVFSVRNAPTTTDEQVPTYDWTLSGVEDSTSISVIVAAPGFDPVIPIVGKYVERTQTVNNVTVSIT